MGAAATSSEADFSFLSLKDLVEARDLYHFHLMNHPNVVGTAVGLYLTRDDQPTAGTAAREAYDAKKPARTFNNSSVRDTSWPCIMVLVNEWVQEADFGKPGQPKITDAVPKRLYLPDGRAVPVCTVLAPPVATDSIAVPKPQPLPNHTFGGGMPAYVTVQHEEHVATFGCLVTDGHTTYALTAGHVCGPAGTPVYGALRAGRRYVGRSAGRDITRRLFSEVYPALPMRQTWLSLDVGLVELDRVGEWTPNTFGLPRMQSIFDLYEQNLSLRRLIGQSVVAKGARSGISEGTIRGLFYRFKSVGAFDYVSDLLIAPSRGGVGLLHGDSGAVWYLQAPFKGSVDERPFEQRDLRPLAVQWGAQSFQDSDGRSTYSLATSLSNVCKLLNVELVVEGSKGVAGTWGADGHYSIATLAIEQVKTQGLQTWLEANADSLSLSLDDIKAAKTNTELLTGGFVPLADVPDIVWKQLPNKGKVNKNGDPIGVTGGRDTSPNAGPEHPNHHLDGDVPFRNKATFVQACLDDPSLITPAVFEEYFSTSFTPRVDRGHRGILPLRIWQIFNEMKASAKDSPERYLAAAGILAHYVGDSCQPLHGSAFADGIKDEAPDRPRQVYDRNSKSKVDAYRGQGVHSAYETTMISSAVRRKQDGLFDLIANAQATLPAIPAISTGKEAALATLRCMAQVAEILPPRTLIDIYEASFTQSEDSRLGYLWDHTRDATAKVMALGVQLLAALWEGAWQAGGGAGDPGVIATDTLKKLYEDRDFLPSCYVDQIDQHL